MPDSKARETFRVLSSEEYKALTSDEKVEYIARAIEAMQRHLADEKARGEATKESGAAEE